MSTRLSCRAPILASVSLMIALGTMAGPAEHCAFAQSQAPGSKKQRDKKAQAEPKAGDPSATEEEQRKAAEAEEDKKKAASEAAPKSKEFDDTVEAKKAIYFSGDVAFTRSDLAAMANKMGFDKSSANGFLFGLSTGLRLHDLRFGVRWRIYDTTEFTLWTFALSAGYALPLRPVSPVFSAHLGYVFDQSIEAGLVRKSLPSGVLLPPDIDVKGLLAGIDINASYWVTKFFRMGAFIGADLMFLSREKAALPATIFGAPTDFAQNPLYSETGSGIGVNMNLGLRGAFDIGLP